MIFFEANSEDPDETPHYVASHLGLRCLTMFHLWDARLKWVNLHKGVIIFLIFNCGVLSFQTLSASLIPKYIN